MVGRLLAINRGLYLAGVGALLLAACACFPWSSPPSGSRSFVNPAGELVLREDAHWTELLARLVAFCGAAFILQALWRRPVPPPGTMRVAWLMAAFLLAFPCWQNQWAPEQVFEKQLLFHQMGRVIGDMEDNVSEQQQDWRSWQSFSANFLHVIPGVRTTDRTWEATFFSLSRWTQPLAEVLGISREFLGFFNPKLLAALLGAVALLLLGLHLASDLAVAEVGRQLAGGLAFTAMLMAIPLIPRLVGEFLLAQAEQAVYRGQPEEALRYLRAAPAWKPELRYSWWYYDKLGQITRLQDREVSPETFVADAYKDLEARNPTGALEDLYRAQALAPEDATVRLLLGITLCEAGVEAFNQGQYSLAQEDWQNSVHYLPTNPTAWYGLSQIRLRLKEFEQAALCLDQVALLQKYLGFKPPTVRSQAFVARCWAASFRGDWNQAHEMYSRSLKPESW